MMEEIFIDSIFFGLILIYMLLAFTTFHNFIVMDDENDDTSYFSSFTIVYLMIYGQFDFVDESNFLEKFCFYMVSLALPLVMLNLLVTMMGDTYSRVNESMNETDLKAMTQLILEIEIVLSNFMKENNKRLYLQKCSVGSELENDANHALKNKFQNCSKRINSLLEKISGKDNFHGQRLLNTIKEIRNNKNKALDLMKANIERTKKEILNSFHKSK